MNPRRLQTILKNSIWIVPTKTLPAYFTIGDAPPQKVIDQTVWIITDCVDGYVFGNSYTCIDGNPSSQTKIVGSITPTGAVLFGFHNGDTITSGIGTLQFRDCCNKKERKDPHNYRFEMQMNTLNSLNQGLVLGISHWSYMIYITPKDKLYHDLPGTDGLSVPEFIAQFENK